MFKLLSNIAISIALSCSTYGYCQDVAFAGLAFSGDHGSIATRFPYSKRFESSLGIVGINGLLQSALPSIHPKNYTIVPRLDELKGRDQAIAVALVLTNESVSTEQIGPVYKLLIQIRGQALFFDFKSMTVLRAYPISFAYIDALSEPPTDAVKDRDVAYIYKGTGGKPGLIDRFITALTGAALPSGVSRFVQVSNVAIGDEARAIFPPEYHNGSAETWLADTFGEELSGKLGIPILPYSKGYAIGNVMSMTISDDSVYNLTLPKPDYQFSVELLKLKTVPFEVQAAGRSLIFGSLVSIKLEEPLSGHIYIDSQFKNGEVKIVPISQVNIENFPAYQDSIKGLFSKFFGVISGDNNPWLKSAAIGPNIDKQVLATRELLKSCK